MEQLWNRAGATGGKGSGCRGPESGLISAKLLAPAATCCRLDRMVSRASAVGCHPLREVPSLRRRGSSSRTLGRLVRRAGGPRESLLHHYAMSAIRARACTCVVSQDGTEAHRGREPGESTLAQATVGVSGTALAASPNSSQE